MRRELLLNKNSNKRDIRRELLLSRQRDPRLEERPRLIEERNSEKCTLPLMPTTSNKKLIGIETWSMKVRMKMKKTMKMTHEQVNEVILQ